MTLRAESQAALRWIGQKITWVGVSAAVGFLLVPVFASRQDNHTFVLMGVVALPLAYIAFRLYRPGICTTGDALRLLRSFGFSTAAAPITNGTIEATLTFTGADSALWGGYAALGSTRYLILKAPWAAANIGPITIRKYSGRGSLLALRAQQHNAAGASFATDLQEAVKQLDYLDVNVEATDNTLTVDVYGSFFQGPELRWNITNALQLVQLMTSEQSG